MAELAKDDLQVAILHGLTDILGKSTVLDVRVNEASGYQGDPLLYILVITNWQKSQFRPGRGQIFADGIDSEKLYEVRRYLREKFENLGVDALPVISYIAKDEVKQFEDAM